MQYTGSSNIFSNDEQPLFLNLEMDKKSHRGQTKPEIKRVIEQNQLKILGEDKIHVLDKKTKKNPA
ncbi:protein-glutamine gamma-glutamyltransferase [Bacillus sp. NRRL B-14911]|nr:protein-glutamine gamma-glutamyltransferase [Bacillus sp. NRRL B-14911]